MDAYHDEGMGDVIFGEPFLREVGIKARRFEGMITIYNGNESVTYQMVRSHPRFKHHTNEQCNKIPSLLKVSDKDKKNGISHPYQKLKGFYKGVLNLGHDYIRDAKTEEWFTCGHISVHEIMCMTRSSMSKLFTPYKKPGREFRSSRKHFKTLSLDELRSPGFDLFSGQEDIWRKKLPGYGVSDLIDTAYQTYWVRRIELIGYGVLGSLGMAYWATRYGVLYILGNGLLIRQSLGYIIHVKNNTVYLLSDQRYLMSSVARPKIEDKDHFELKGQFLKELRENIFIGSNHEDANEHIEKFLEIVDLFHAPNITQDQLMLRVFPISLTGAASRWLRNEPTGSIKTWKEHKTKFLNKYCPLARTAKKMEEINNFQQELDEPLFQACEHFKELLMKCLTTINKGLIQANPTSLPPRLIGEASTGILPSKSTNAEEVDIETLTLEQYLALELNNTRRSSARLYNSTLKVKGKLLREFQKITFSGRPTDNAVEHISNILEVTSTFNAQESTLVQVFPLTLEGIAKRNHPLSNALADLGASISIMPYSLFKRLELGSLKPIKMAIEMADRSIQSPKGMKENVLVKISNLVFPIDFIILDIAEDKSVPIILGRPMLATAHAKIDVYDKKIPLGVGNNQVIFTINKRESPTSIALVWASCNPSNEKCDGGSLCNNEIQCYWESENDNELVNIEWNDLSLNNWLKIKYGEVDETMKKKILTEHWRKQFKVDYDESNDFYDPEQCGESMRNGSKGRLMMKTTLKE
ncbi:putative ribonuclease H-like domain-containing protein [Tanacetum coccineum]